MDSARFDALSRSLTDGSSRRGLLAMLASGLLAALPLRPFGEGAEAKKKKGKKKKKKKGQDNTSQNPVSPPQPVCTPSCTGGRTCQGGICACPGGTRLCEAEGECEECCSDVDCCGQHSCPPSSPTCLGNRTCSVTCTDGVRNGSESDIDCGGVVCTRCGYGKICASSDDCANALCSGGRCRECSVDSECGSDGNGGCLCRQQSGGAGVCVTAEGTSGFSGCNPCPADTICYVTGLTNHNCAKLCGAA